MIFISPVPIHDETEQYYSKLLGLKNAVDSGEVEDQSSMSERYHIITPEAINSFQVGRIVWGQFFMNVLTQAPDPETFGSGWREQWLKRLGAIKPVIHTWLRHQRRDSYWQHGSVNEDYSLIKCPVYAVGGFVDGYTNAVPRLLENLNVPRKGLIGPHGHNVPDQANPGPAIGFFHEEVRWWDHWLKDINTGIMEEPMLQVYMQEKVPGETWPDPVPGRWVAEES